MAKFTPGPWKASKAGPLGEATVSGDFGLSGFIAQVQGQGNADLMASAPELRDLLVEFRKDWAWRLEGCSDSECLSCKRRKDFLTRIDDALRKSVFNG